MRVGSAVLNSEVLTRRAMVACALVGLQRVVPFRKPDEDVGMMAAGTLISLNIKTASSGPRVEINPTDGLIQYDGSGYRSFQVDLVGEVYARTLLGLNLTGSTSGSHVSLLNGSFEIWNGSEINIDPANAAISLGPGPAALKIQTASGQSINLRPAATDIASIDVDGIRVFNVASEPSAPASGGTFYVYGGALKYVSAGGTRTVVAPD